MADASNLGGVLATPLEGPMWEACAALARTPRVAEASDNGRRARVLWEEAELRDRLVTFSYALDSHDLDGVLDFFDADAVLVNPRGTFEGRDAIRANYVRLLGAAHNKMHLITNVVVRIIGDDGAHVCSYYSSLLELNDGGHAAPAGTYLDYWVKRDGAWRIRARRITVGFNHALEPTPFVHAAAADATRPVTSRDLEVR